MIVHDVDIDHTVVHNFGPPRRLAIDGAPHPRTYGPAPRRLAAASNDAKVFGAMAAIAIDCLCAPSLARAAADIERHQDVQRANLDSMPTVDDAEAGTWRLTGPARIQSRQRSGLIEAIEITGRATRMSATDHIAYRTQHAIPRRPQPPRATQAAWPHNLTTDSVVQPSDVPQTLWPTVMDQLPCATDKDTGAWGVVAAMTLLRMGTFQRWAPIALQLGLPASFARTPDAVTATLVDHNMFDEALYVLDELHRLLEDTPPPIDYARRRRTFDDLTDPGPGWRQACRDAGVIPTDRRRVFAGHMLYELITGSDARQRQTYPIPPGEQRVAYKRFTAFPDNALSDYLHMRARQLLREQTIDEPVTWSPVFDHDDRWRAPHPQPGQRSARETTSRSRDHAPGHDIVNAMAASEHHDAALVDLIAHARTPTRPLRGPQPGEPTSTFYIRQNQSWALSTAGVAAAARLTHTFGPSVDLSIWDETPTPARQAITPTTTQTA